MSATANRRPWLLRERRAVEREIVTSAEFRIADVPDLLAQIVKVLLEPLFALYEFWKVDDEAYDEIVAAFIDGRVT